MWWVSGSRDKTRGQCCLVNCDWPGSSRLACLLDHDWLGSSRLAHTGELRQVPSFWKSKCTSSTSPGHLPHGPDNGPLLSNSLPSGTQQMEGNTLVLACEWVWDLGYFFLWGKFFFVCGRLKFKWVVHFLSPFLYTLAFSVNFYTIICYHRLLGVNQVGYFVSLCLGWILWWWLGHSLWHWILSATNLKSI